MSDQIPSAPMRSLIVDLRSIMAAQDERRAVLRRRRRLGVPAIAIAGALGVSAAVAAVTGVLPVEQGKDYVIEKQAPNDAQTLCLQLRAPGTRRPTFGCGTAPSDANPFGLLVVDRTLSTDESMSRAVVYGVVSDRVQTVALGGKTAETRQVAGIPGRYFSMQLTGLTKVRAAARASDGSVIARLGGTAPAGAPTPTNLQEARAQGQLAGFAPAAAPASRVSYRGRELTSAAFDALIASGAPVSCTEDQTVTIVCRDR